MDQHQVASLIAAAEREILRFTDDLDPDSVSPIEAAAAIEELADIEHLVAGVRARLADRIDDAVTGTPPDLPAGVRMAVTPRS